MVIERKKSKGRKRALLIRILDERKLRVKTCEPPARIFLGGATESGGALPKFGGSSYIAIFRVQHPIEVLFPKHVWLQFTFCFVLFSQLYIGRACGGHPETNGQVPFW
jgi:hypothetical protein